MIDLRSHQHEDVALFVHPTHSVWDAQAQLLGGAGDAKSDDPRKVIVEKMSLVVEGRPDVELDLTGILGFTLICGLK